MKKIRKKKKLKSLIFIITIILLILIFLNIMENLHSKEKMIQRLISGLNNLNYSYVNEDGDIIKVLGKLEKVENNKTIIYIDYDEKISDKIYLNTIHRESYKNNGIEDMEYYNNFIVEFFEDNNYTYYYRGKKELNGNKCTIVDFVTEKSKSNNGKYGITIWINDSLNIVEKVEHYVINNKKRNVYDSINYNFHTNENSVTTVQAPDTIYTEYSSNTNG